MGMYLLFLTAVVLKTWKSVRIHAISCNSLEVSNMREVYELLNAYTIFVRSKSGLQLQSQAGLIRRTVCLETPSKNCVTRAEASQSIIAHTCWPHQAVFYVQVTLYITYTGDSQIWPDQLHQLQLRSLIF